MVKKLCFYGLIFFVFISYTYIKDEATFLKKERRDARRVGNVERYYFLLVMFLIILQKLSIDTGFFREKATNGNC